VKALLLNLGLLFAPTQDPIEPELELLHAG
jgi:hypothetical protein